MTQGHGAMTANDKGLLGALFAVLQTVPAR